MHYPSQRFSPLVALFIFCACRQSPNLSSRAKTPGPVKCRLRYVSLCLLPPESSHQPSVSTPQRWFCCDPQTGAVSVVHVAGVIHRNESSSSPWSQWRLCEVFRVERDNPSLLRQHPELPSAAVGIRVGTEALLPAPTVSSHRQKGA